MSLFHMVTIIIINSTNIFFNFKKIELRLNEQFIQIDKVLSCTLL